MLQQENGAINMIGSQYFREMIDSDENIICIVNLAGVFCYVNRTYQDKLGYSLPELVGKKVSDLVHPDDLEATAGLLGAFSSERASEKIRFRFKHKNEAYFWLESHCKQLGCINEESYIYVISNLVDLNEKIQANQPGKFYQAVIETMAEGVVVQSKSGKIYDVNKQAQEILGLSADQLLGKTSMDPLEWFVRPDGEPFPREAQPSLTTLRTGRPCKDVMMGFNDSEGRTRWILVNSMPLFNKESEYPQAVVSTFHDITIRKHAEDELLAVNERIENIFSSLNEVFWSYDLTSEMITEISQACTKVLGYPAYAFYSNPHLWEELIHPEDLSRISSLWTELKNGQKASVEFRIFHANRQVRWINSEIIPVMDSMGQLIRLDGVWTDITVQKESQMELAYRDRLLTGMAKGSHILLQTGEFDQNIQRALQILGEAAGVDRVSIFELKKNQNNEYYWLLRYEWAAAGLVPRTNDELWTVYLKEYEEPYQKILNGEAVQIIASELPDDLKKRIEKKQIKSSLNMPIFTQNWVWGMIGFHDCQKVRRWTEQEESVLTIAAAGYGAAVERRLADSQLRRSHAQIKESEIRYKSLMHQSADGICICNMETWQIEEVNERFLCIFGYSEEEALKLNLRDLVAHNDQSVIKNIENIVNYHYWSVGSRQYRHKDGCLLDVEVTASQILLDQKKIIRISIRDISERKKHEQQLRLSETVFQNMSEAVLITDPEGIILNVNPAFGHMTGYDAEEVIGRKLCKTRSAVHHPEFYREIWRHLHKEGFWQGEMWSRRKNGEVFVQAVHIRGVQDEEARALHYVAVFADITDRKKYEMQMHHQAFHDALTELPNRVYYQKRLVQAIQENKPGEILAVLFVDLDGFKGINDQYGHDAGDWTLKTVAQRMKLCLRGDDLAARMGGDEFTIMLPHLRQVSAAQAVAKRLVEKIAEPIYFNGKELRVTSSIGMTYYPKSKVEAEELIKQADEAMYEAKQNGKNQYCCYKQQETL